MQSMFETENLRIRPFRAEDAATLFQNHLDDEQRKWFPNECFADVQKAEEAVIFYQNCVQAHRLPYVLAIELKGSGMLIGDTGINLSEGTQTEVEIGYSICSNQRGKGYATEVLDAMTWFCSKQFGLKTLYARVLHGNHASVRVLEKNGYHFLRMEHTATDDPYGNGVLVYAKNCE